MKILITGGTVFVSRYAAEYFLCKGHEVYVLNRNSKPQVDGVRLIEADRHNLGDRLKEYVFDAVLDITAYTAQDVEDLLDALGTFGEYVLISSSAVYGEALPQPLEETQECRGNAIWRDYGVNKAEAERYLLDRLPEAYIIRPPFLYGQESNSYRECFVFDCAEEGRPFYVPEDGQLKIQFFHIDDLCKMMERILEVKPADHIFNVGNPELVAVEEWAKLCYSVLGKTAEIRYVPKDVFPRFYFPFFVYELQLDITRQSKLLPETKPLYQGLCEAYQWYQENRDASKRLGRLPYLEYIKANFEKE